MDKDLNTFFNTPLKIGDKTIQKRLVLAPMAGLGHIAFRELVSTYGGYGLLFTEMCNAKAVPHENRFMSPVFRWRDEEVASLVCQIFGADPDAMARAAVRIEKEGFFGVDINMGCSVKAMCKKNYCAALLKTPDLAEKIVSTVRKAVSIPVFVKYRIGWKDDAGFPVEMAKRFEQAGADALTFHPRIAPDRRSRPPKWDYIGSVKKAVSIPVFGNGNVFDQDDAVKMIDRTDADGISLGRIAISKPFIFSAWTDNLKITPEIYRDTVLGMIRLLKDHFDKTSAIKRFKKFAIYFSGNFVFSHAIYKKMVNYQSFEETEDRILELFENPPAIAKRPNLNMFTK